jgi:hypothetical protein
MDGETPKPKPQAELLPQSLPGLARPDPWDPAASRDQRLKSKVSASLRFRMTN